MFRWLSARIEMEGEEMCNTLNISPVNETKKKRPHSNMVGGIPCILKGSGETTIDSITWKCKFFTR